MIVPRLAAFASAFAIVSSGQPPLPEPNFAHPLVPSACTADAGNPYEAAQYREEGWSGPAYQRYPGGCQRLHFTFGPIVIRPGQNDVIIQPITVEKPAYDGDIVRFRPNLLRADGSVPPIEQIHLHHAVWYTLSGEAGLRGNSGAADLRNYGNGPFFASGEEKTIFDLPRGYGFPVKATDQWQLLYMIHNQRAQSDTVWITYDIDYVASDTAVAQQLHTTYPVWLDVRPSIYPGFNAQRKYGHLDPTTHRYICTYPSQQTADFNPWGKTETSQGVSGNATGTPLTFPARGQPIGRTDSFTGGTLIGVGGHLHPGGLSVDLDLQRASQRQRIFTSEAHYWNWTNPAIDTGPPTSWDLSMGVTGLPRWGVHVEPGDTLWMNATYDVGVQSTYEDMGIAVAWLAPDTAAGPAAPGLNPFGAPIDASEPCLSGGLAAPVPTLCDKGVVTHGHMAEASHHGGPSGTLPARVGPQVSRIDITGFTYQPGDQGAAGSAGVPSVPIGGSLTFANNDQYADVYHSVTSCRYPCTGPTGIAFPLSDGASSSGAPVDFDSGELGYDPTFGTTRIGPAKNQGSWTLNVTAANGFQPGATYTFYCRVHPFMRGAFAVVAPGSGPGPPPPPKPGPAPPHAGGDWRSYGHDLSNTRNQDQERTIATGNAGALSPWWTFSSRSAGGEGDFTGTPVVADGYVIAASNRGWVFALNADSGAVVWKRQLSGGGVNSSVAVSGGMVIANVSATAARSGGSGAAGGPYVIALDEATGAVRWQSPAVDVQAGSDLYSSPVVVGNTVISGVSGGAAELGPAQDRVAFHGSVVFLDAGTGQMLKKTWTIPQSDWPKGYAGGGVWSTPAVDARSLVAYVGTGNPFQKERQHPNTDAILRLDVNRAHPSFGAILATYQGEVDTYSSSAGKLPCVAPPGNPPPYYPQGAGSCGQIDLDFGAAPNLFTGPGGRLVVGEGQKSGVYHAVDAATMKRLWSTMAGPPSPGFGGVVGSTAIDRGAVYGPITIPGYVWSLDRAGHGMRWASPVGDGLHWGEPVAVANGVVYTVDLKGFLDAYDAKTGLPLLHRPIALGANTGTSPTLSWGGVSIARNTVYAAVGITSQANGFIVAFRPNASEGGSGPVPPPPGGGGTGAGPAVLAGPGAYITNYATPVMAIQRGTRLSFLNEDLPQHDVVAVDLGPNGAPLFASALIGIGEEAAVTGTDALKSGSYAFYCTIHPGMRGTLYVVG